MIVHKDFLNLLKQHPDFNDTWWSTSIFECSTQFERGPMIIKIAKLINLIIIWLSDCPHWWRQIITHPDNKIHAPKWSLLLLLQSLSLLSWLSSNYHICVDGSGNTGCKLRHNLALAWGALCDHCLDYYYLYSLSSLLFFSITIISYICNFRRV